MPMTPQPDQRHLPDGLVEVEEAHGKIRIALRRSESEAEFLWISRDQAAEVLAKLQDRLQ